MQKISINQLEFFRYLKENNISDFKIIKHTPETLKIENSSAKLFLTLYSSKEYSFEQLKLKIDPCLRELKNFYSINDTVVFRKNGLEKTAKINSRKIIFSINPYRPALATYKSNKESILNIEILYKSL